MAKEFLDVTPDVSLFPKIGRVGFTLVTALPEFIDNSMDNWDEECPPLIVRVTLDRYRDTIIIDDNSRGLSLAELQKAMKIALSPGKASTDPIGEYGFGLKAATTFLANHFELVTRKHFSQLTHRVIYDQAEFLSNDKWLLPFETLPPEAKPTTGTTITLSELNVDIGTIGNDEIVAHLASVYRAHLQRGQLTVIVNDTRVQPATWTLLPEPKWDVDFPVARGKRVFGWIGVRSSEDLPKNAKAGFDLIHRGRVIKYNELVGIEQHPRIRHMVGELHLDEFDVNNNKTDFRRDSAEWRDFVQKITTLLSKLRVRTVVYEATRVKKKAPLKKDKASLSESGPHPDLEGEAAQTPVEIPARTPVQAPPSLADTAGATYRPGMHNERASDTPHHTTTETTPAQDEPSGPSWSVPAGAISLSESAFTHATADHVLGSTIDPKADAASRGRRESISLNDLHPEIRSACEKLYRQGHASLAVRAGLEVVNRYARGRASVTDDKGVPTMRNIFMLDRAQNIPAQLRVSPLTTAAQRDEQESLLNLVVGAQFMRNVLVHEDKNFTSAVAFEYLALASLLCREIEACTVTSV